MGAASAEAESRSSSADRAPTPDNPAAWEPLVFQQTGLPCPATGGIGTARFSADRAPTPGDRRHRNRSSSAGRAPTPGNPATGEPPLLSRPGSHARQPGGVGTARFPAGRAPTPGNLAAWEPLVSQQAGLPRPATGGVGAASAKAGRLLKPSPVARKQIQQELLPLSLKPLSKI
jgi:hypothetical protein